MARETDADGNIVLGGSTGKRGVLAPEDNTADEGKGLFSGDRSREILREGGLSEDEIDAIHSGPSSQKHAEVADSGLADIVVSIRDNLESAGSYGGDFGRQAVERRAKQALNSAEADAKGLSAGEAEDRAEQLSEALDVTPGSRLAEAKDALVNVYRGRAREARGDHHAESGGYLSGFSPEDLSGRGGGSATDAGRQSDWSESSASDLVGSLAKGETEPTPDVSTDDLQAALSRAEAKRSVCEDMGWTDTGADSAVNALSAALQARGGVTRAALSGETSDSVLVDVGADSGAVARVSLSPDGAGVSVERVEDHSQPALSVSQFNAAASGVTLETEDAADVDGAVDVTPRTTGADVTLPGVRETVEAPTSGAEPQGEGGESEVAALQARAKTARAMGWDAAADDADERAAALQGGEN